MPARNALLAGAAALLAFFLWRRNARAAPFVPTGPSPQPPIPTGPSEEPIPPMSEEEASTLFQEAQGSSDINGFLTPLADTFFENDFSQYGRAIENAINWYGSGVSCNLVTCIDSQIRPNLDRLAQTQFWGLFHQLNAHQAIVIANAQARGEV